LTTIAAAQGIGNLVLENGKDPGLERGLAPKGIGPVEGCHEGILHHVLGQLVIAQLTCRIGQHLGAEGSHLLRRIHGGQESGDSSEQVLLGGWPRNRRRWSPGLAPEGSRRVPEHETGIMQ